MSALTSVIGEHVVAIVPHCINHLPLSTRKLPPRLDAQFAKRVQYRLLLHIRVVISGWDVTFRLLFSNY